MNFLQVLRDRLASINDQRRAVLDEMDAIAAGADAEGRLQLSDGEQRSITRLEARLGELDTDALDRKSVV